MELHKAVPMGWPTEEMRGRPGQQRARVGVQAAHHSLTNQCARRNGLEAMFSSRPIGMDGLLLHAIP